MRPMNSRTDGTTREPTASTVQRILTWYAAAARDLPWRRPDASVWGILVSEVMLQQTPVTRVLPAWEAWLTRWPTPADLASDPPAEAVRAWGRLGYPRRALRLHAAAVAMVERHDGQVPSSLSELISTTGVPKYNALGLRTRFIGGSWISSSLPSPRQRTSGRGCELGPM